MSSSASTVTFHSMNWSAFSTKKNNETLTEGGLYFITDRGKVLRATSSANVDEYNGGLIQWVTSSTIPTAANAIEDVLYIETDTKKGKMRNAAGTAYEELFAPSSAPNGTITNGNAAAVSGGTVYTELYTTLNLSAATTSSVANGVVKMDGSGYINTDIIKKASTYASGDSGSKNKLLQLDSTGKIDSTLLPDIALSTYVENANTTTPALAGTYANLANLTAQEGDWSQVTAINESASPAETDAIKGSYMKISGNQWIKLVDKHDITSTIQEDSTAVITSGAVYDALEWKTA